jgi:3',5'-cyclic AMP phosphodiesterase CpdA
VLKRSIFFFLLLLPVAQAAQRGTNITVQAIKPPKEPLLPESMTAGVTKFAFFVYGDTRGRRDGKEEQYEHSLVIDSMLSTIAKRRTNGIPVRFVLQSGDAVVNGMEPKQWNASFVTLINRITTQGGIPYFLAPGNHDVTAAKEISSTNRMKGLSNYLAVVTQLIPRNGAERRLDNYPVFAFGYGNSFFLALDSNIAGETNQYQWAVQQLEGLDRDRYQNIFAFFHHPPFSSGGHGGSKIEEPARDLRKLYMPLFRKHHVRAIFAGHEHLFEHWVERYQDAVGKKYRMDQFVTGGGGAPLYGYRGEPDTGGYIDTYKTEKVELEHLVRPGPKPGDNPYHYLVIEVDGTKMKVEVIGIDWGSDFKPYRSNTAVLD